MKENKKELIKKKKTPIPFISSIKKPLDNISNIKATSDIFYDLSYVPQAYVFYKLAKIQVTIVLLIILYYGFALIYYYFIDFDLFELYFKLVTSIFSFLSFSSFRIKIEELSK